MLNMYVQENVGDSNVGMFIIAVVPKLFKKRPQFQKNFFLKIIATPIMYEQFAKKYILQQKQHVL